MSFFYSQSFGGIYDGLIPTPPPVQEPPVQAPAPPPRRRSRRLPVNIRAALIDRLEAAVESGVIDLQTDDGKPAEKVYLSTGELALLIEAMLGRDLKRSHFLQAGLGQLWRAYQKRIALTSERVNSTDMPTLSPV
jgi:hypothetical protein